MPVKLLDRAVGGKHMDEPPPMSPTIDAPVATLPLRGTCANVKGNREQKAVAAHAFV